MRGLIAWRQIAICNDGVLMDCKLHDCRWGCFVCTVQEDNPVPIPATVKKSIDDMTNAGPLVNMLAVHRRVKLFAQPSVSQ